jgi:hypothetical protein
MITATASQQGRTVANNICLFCAMSALDRVLFTHRYFTMDDVRREHDRTVPRCREAGAATSNPKALGGIILEARRRGECEPTDVHQRSADYKINHGRPMRVWRSLCVGGTAT